MQLLLCHCILNSLLPVSESYHIHSTFCDNRLFPVVSLIEPDLILKQDKVLVGEELFDLGVSLAVRD